MPPRLLLIDDNVAYCELLRDYFKLDDYEIEFSHNGDSGLSLALSGAFDLIILDVMLPKRSGLELLRQLRERGSPLPILMLTARGDDIDRILGLEIGVDDYISKPCNPREIAARIRAILRRSQGAKELAIAQVVLTVDDITVPSPAMAGAMNMSWHCERWKPWIL